MVFQLITFFMLVVNFKTASLDMNLKLPVVGSARPVDVGNDPDRIVMNINAQGQLIVFEQAEDVEQFVRQQAHSIREIRRLSGKPLADDAELPTTVVIRADQSTPFADVNRAIKACQSQGFRKFALKAMNREVAP
ncbi:ExbD/TolR family protein [Planctomicrobium sp. SH664]|uniref:ExbD/TolR family protein n=1 Tax=Planctomicrobium sp. SH664 TaxID=3448125 RepID=UPI003F5C49E9